MVRQFTQDPQTTLFYLLPVGEMAENILRDLGEKIAGKYEGQRASEAFVSTVFALDKVLKV